MSEFIGKFGVNGFYGKRNKRKWIGIERSLNESVEKQKQQKIPKAFPSRILGPTSGWKTFFRQKDAFEFSRSKAKDLHVFAFESDTFEANTGQRMYLVASYPVFWYYYNQLVAEKRHHYEVIPEGAVCKLYFDLEFNTLLNPNSNGNRMVSILMQVVFRALELEFGVKCREENVLDMDASTQEKFSRHLVFQLNHAVFKDNIHAGRFVSYVMSELMSYRQKRIKHTKNSDKCNILESITSDNKYTQSSENGREEDKNFSICGTSRDNIDSNCTPLQQHETSNNTVEYSLELPHSTSHGTRSILDTDRQNTSPHDKHCCDKNESKEDLNDEQSETKVTKTTVTDLDKRYSCLFQNFTPDELDSLVVKNKHEEEVLFCDLGVYTKNRNFRLYLSSKLNKKNPLVLSVENKVEVPQKEEEIFLQSLISNPRFTSSTKVLTFERESNCGLNYTRRRSDKGKCSDSIEGYNKSPYTEVDDFITSLITENGNRGAIRHWSYFHQGELLLYEISRYRFCHNIGREHKSNNIMFIVDLQKGVFYQKCHDPDCHFQNYKSPEWQLPRSILPESYFTDVEDDFELEMDDQELLDSTLELEQSIQDKYTHTDDLDDGNDEDLICAAQIMEKPSSDLYLNL